MRKLFSLLPAGLLLATIFVFFYSVPAFASNQADNPSSTVPGEVVAGHPGSDVQTKKNHEPRSPSFVTCNGANCNDTDPSETGCSLTPDTADIYTIGDSSFKVILRWSGTCKTNWTKAETSGFSAYTIYVQRHDHGLQPWSIKEDYQGGGSYTNQIYSPGPARAAYSVNGGNTVYGPDK